MKMYRIAFTQAKEYLIHPAREALINSWVADEGEKPYEIAGPTPCDYGYRLSIHPKE